MQQLVGNAPRWAPLQSCSVCTRLTRQPHGCGSGAYLRLGDCVGPGRSGSLASGDRIRGERACVNAACTQEVTDKAERQGHGFPRLDRFAPKFKLYPIKVWVGTASRFPEASLSGPNTLYMVKRKPLRQRSGSLLRQLGFNRHRVRRGTNARHTAGTTQPLCRRQRVRRREPGRAIGSVSEAPIRSRGRGLVAPRPTHWCWNGVC